MSQSNDHAPLLVQLTSEIAELTPRLLDRKAAGTEEDACSRFSFCKHPTDIRLQSFRAAIQELYRGKEVSLRANSDGHYSESPAESC